MAAPKYDKLTLARARALRASEAPAEAKLWAMLRGRRLRAKFRRQQPIGTFIVDFFCAEARLIVEVDGPSHETRGAYDARRTAWLEGQGYRVVRLTNEQVHQRPEEVYRVLADALDSPHPGRQGATGPSPSRGEGLRAAALRIDRLDAEVLMAHLLGVSRLELLLDLGVPAPEGFDVLVARRAAGEPVAYITGRREFWSLDLVVGPGVLIPRPDSETLIEAAVAHFAGRAPATVLDLGTGSGALLLAALSQWPGATGVGLDASPDALAYARRNAADFGGRARIAAGGWAGTGAAFDLVLCNPPYIAAGTPLPRDVADWEPHTALFAGEDGLDCYRQIAPLIGAQIAPGGAACIEIGHDQGDSAAALFRAQALAVTVRPDLAGLPRCLVVTK